MTQSQHTGGGWNRNIKPASKYNTIFAGRNTHICHLATNGLTEEEIEGNANLIAAAPDLLEALEWAAQFAPNGAAKDRAQRIINKAKGG